MITSEMPYKLKRNYNGYMVPQLYWLKDAKDKDNKNKLRNRDLPKEL